MANNRMYLVCTECREQLKDRVGGDISDGTYAFQLGKMFGMEYSTRFESEALDKFYEDHTGCSAGNENVFVIDYEQWVKKDKPT